jgi:SAM-dependent methyltransferase
MTDPQSNTATWDHIFSTQEWGRYPSEDVVRFVAKYLRGDTPMQVLDVGCGTGSNMLMLAEEGFQVSGIDSSPVAVERCRARMSEEYTGPREDWSVDTALHDRESGGNYFHAAIDGECLSCNDYETARAMIVDIHHVLRPGGLFYSRTFTTATSSSLLKDRGYIRYSSVEDVMVLFKDFHILSLEKMERTVGGHQYGALISEWCITTKKPL